MESQWNVLVVDDEPDIHLVTQLSLKHKIWQNKRFKLTSAHSAEEARGVIFDSEQPFDVALVDVVMESDQAGLELCAFIRENCPSSTRIVLRTGQPGQAPEEQVMNEFDIDYYVAKAEATEQRLFAVIRACLRSSQEISTLLTVDAQLRGLTRAIRYAPTPKELRMVMSRSLSFLEEKYGCKAVFSADLSLGDEGLCPPSAAQDHSIALENIFRALEELHGARTDDRKAFEGNLAKGADYGLSPRSYLKGLIVMEGASEAPIKEGIKDKFFRVLTQPPGGVQPTEETAKTVDGGLWVDFSESGHFEKNVHAFFRDAERFVENWAIAYSVLCLLQDNADERAARKKATRGW